LLKTWSHHLNTQIEAILKPLLHRNEEHICIIDPPGHPNVGDSAIFLGELDFIAKHFSSSRVSCYDVDGYSSSADRYIEEATILLIHGGGNFGDIWPHHHKLRMRILERFPHKTIVQLPQTIHFSDQVESDETAALIRRQRDFTLLVRDQKSFAYAKTNFDCNVLLSPDMAFAMKPIVRETPTLEYLCLLRTDKEMLANHQLILEVLQRTDKSVEVRDWLDRPLKSIAGLDRLLKKLTRKHPMVTAPIRTAMMNLRRQYAKQRLEYGIRLLSKGTTVVTDRLHAHILCCLLDIPHFIFDSYGGKISAFHATWTSDNADSHLIRSPDELSNQLVRLRFPEKPAH
jgi:exopolysaccharide biosynthesis predicted pyruvyltransferase EpsI